MPRLYFPRLFALAIILWLGAAHAAAAQESSPPPLMHATGLTGGVFHFAADVGREFSTQATYPFRLARDRPGRFLVGAALVAGMISMDGETREIIASPEFVQDHGLEAPSQWISDVASPRYAIPIAAGVAVMGMIGSGRERETSRMLAEALITSSAWTGALKQLTGRERPRETTEELPDWTGPGALFTTEPTNGHSLHSFPSGHTSGAWAMATVVAHQYSAHGIVPILAYTAATAMGYSRIVVGAHWLSDVAVGGLIGYGCARQVISAHEDRDIGSDHAESNGWHLYLQSDHDLRGAGLSYQF